MIGTSIKLDFCIPKTSEQLFQEYQKVHGQNHDSSNCKVDDFKVCSTKTKHEANFLELKIQILNMVIYNINIQEKIQIQLMIGILEMY